MVVAADETKVEFALEADESHGRLFGGFDAFPADAARPGGRSVVMTTRRRFQQVASAASGTL